MDVKKLLASLESAYEVELPKLYRKFMESGEFETKPKIRLSGYFRGSYDLDFTSEFLPDLDGLGLNVGIYDIGDCPWSEHYARYVPIIELSSPDEPEPKMFVVMDVEKEGNPVLLFHYEGWRLYPLAEGFVAFAKALPNAKTDISKSFQPWNKSEKPKPRNPAADAFNAYLESQRKTMSELAKSLPSAKKKKSQPSAASKRSRLRKA